MQPGRTMALVGQTASGKSTLTKILYGLYQPDAGSIAVNGQGVHFRSPAEAVAAAIAMVWLMALGLSAAELDPAVGG